jgi:plasmid stability protein
MEPLQLEILVPTTLTLKNIPDEVYARLRDQATLNRRSLNSEAILCFETVLNMRPVDSQARLTRLRAVRASLGDVRFEAADIDGLKREGRA